VPFTLELSTHWKEIAKMKKDESIERIWITAVTLFFLAACAAPLSTIPSSPLALNSLDARVRFVGDIPAPGVAHLTVDVENRLIAVKQDGGMEFFSRKKGKGTPLSAIAGQAMPVTRRPLGATTGDGKIYVTDGGKHEVVLLDPKGLRIDSFGSRGGGPKAFNVPSGITFIEDRVYVADSGNRRIQILGVNGEYITSVGPILTVKDEKTKKALLEKPAPKDLNKEELEKIKLILRKKTPEDEKPKTVSLMNPIDVAVDPRGLIYIVDAGDDTVKICDASGEFIDKLTQVESPHIIVAAKDGIYLADQEKLSIRKYNYDMKFLYAFGSRGTGPEQFGAIDDLAVDEEGHLFVADGKRGLIHEFFSDPEPPFHVWTKSPPPASIRWVMDLPLKAARIAWDQRENLYAVDGSKVYRIRDGRIERIPIDEKIEPVAVAVDPAGFPWVLDGAGKQAVKIDATGAVLAKPFQLTDKALNWLSKIRDIAVSSKGVVSVADSGNRWIWLQTFKPDGTRLSTVIRNDKSGSMLESPAALSLDEADNLYVLDNQALRIHIYSPYGEPTGSFSIRGKSESPVDLCVIHGEVYIADPGRDRIQVFSTQGAFLREIGIKGSGKGDLINPVGIAVKEDLTLFVADAGNSRIQVLQQALTPGMPSEVNITPGTRSVNIEWKKNPESYPLDYKIYRSVSMEEPFSYIGSTRENRFVDQGVAGGRKYFGSVVNRRLGIMLSNSPSVYHFYASNPL